MYKNVITTEFKGEKLDIFNFNQRRFQAEPIGRSDINNNPIKEGDIVIVGERLDWGGVVVYNDLGCGFCFESENMSEYTFSHGWGESQESKPEEDWEIVGSVYEN